jgi:O-antigen ligase
MNGALDARVRAAAVALPFALFLFILPFPGTVALRLLCLALAFGLAVVCWRRWMPPRVPAKAAIACWAIVTGISVVYSFDVPYSLGEWKNEIGYTLMAYVAFFAFARGRFELSILLAAFGAATVLITGWGVANALRLGMWHEGAGHGGSAGLSVYFAAIAPLFAVAAASANSRRQRYAWLAVLALIVVASIAGRQRMLWPIFFLEAAAGILLARRAGLIRTSSRAMTAGIAAVGVVAITAVAGLQSWRMQTAQARALNEDVRLAMWPRISERIGEHALTGAGLGRQAMRKVHPDLVREGDYFWHAHNMFLNAGLALGIPGVIALLWLIAAFLAAYWRMLQRPETTARWIAIAGILMITGFVARNLTNDLFSRDGALLFWSLNGALLGAGMREGMRTGRTT